MRKVGLVLFSFLVFFGVGTYYKRVKNPPVHQPLRYNHKVHIENGLSCTDCHQGAEKRQRATLPRIEICLDCHEEPLTESPEEAKILQYSDSLGEIPWRRILSLRDHVYFSHMRHVTLAEIQCATCHGKMEKMKTPPPRPLKRMKMAACIKCHKKRSVTIDCNACHR